MSSQVQHVEETQWCGRQAVSPHWPAAGRLRGLGPMDGGTRPSSSPVIVPQRQLKSSRTLRRPSSMRGTFEA